MCQFSETPESRGETEESWSLPGEWIQGLKRDGGRRLWLRSLSELPNLTPREEAYLDDHN